MKKQSVKTKLLSILFILSMLLCLMPTQVFAAEGDTEITEVNIKDVSNELWSHKNVTFATVDESSNYTIDSQKWVSDNSGSITPTSENLKPGKNKEYTFIITLKAKDGYVFKKKSESPFLDGDFLLNGSRYDNAATSISTDGKTLTATLFISTKVKGVTDTPGGNMVVNTTVRNNFTDQSITDNIRVTRKSECIIDVPDGILKSADTKWFKLSSDGVNLIETANQDEAIISLKFISEENKVIVAYTGNFVQTDISSNLKYLYTIYAGSKFTYTGTTTDEGTGKTVINEIRDDYYIRLQFNCPLNLIVPKEIETVEINNAALSFNDGDTPAFTGTIPDGVPYTLVYEAWQAEGEGISSAEENNKGNLITIFDKDKTYTYKLAFKISDAGSEDDWFFGSNTKLKINGQEVALQRDSSDNEQQFSGVTALIMTPLASAVKPDYKIIEGVDGTWKQDSDGTLKFVANGDFSKFTGVKVDGTLVAADQYTAISGSTIITLKKSYLDTLAIGKHTLTVVYNDGECSTEFEILIDASSTNNNGSEGEKNTVVKNPVTKPVIKTDTANVPETGDNSNLVLWVVILFISGAVIVGTTVENKKKKYNR